MTDENNLPRVRSEPVTLEDFLLAGWDAYAKHDQTLAENSFRQAQSLDENSVEAAYGLGLALKMQQRGEPAVEAFQRVIDLIQNGSLQDDLSRASMLRHLSNWHILMIRSGLGQEPQP
jgi:tetratricopeptide (TPR) repeat protein